MKNLLLTTIAFVASTAFGDVSVSESLELNMTKDLRSLLSDPSLKNSTTSIYVYSPDTGQVLFEHESDALLNSASNVKLLSTAAALDTLGHDFRYETKLLGPTPQGGIVRGDVYLLGSWDPTLFPPALTDLARKLKAKGVTRVVGDIYLGSDRRDTLMNSKVRISVRGQRRGQKPRIRIDTPSRHVEIVNNAYTSRRHTKLEVTREHLKTKLGEPFVRITVSGPIRSRRTRRFSQSIEERAVFTGTVLIEKLAARGIEVEGQVRQRNFADYKVANSDSVTPLVTHYSKPASRIAATINKRSINWMADRFINTAASHAYDTKPTMASGVRLMKDWVKSKLQTNTDELVVDTGSGLSYSTKMTTKQIVDIIATASGKRGNRQTAAHQAFLSSLAVGGRDGTLRGRFKGKNRAGLVLGKTGTLTRVIALSGIVKSAEGAPLIFSIVSNGHSKRRRSKVRKVHEKMVKTIHGYSNLVKNYAETSAPPLIDESVY